MKHDHSRMRRHQPIATAHAAARSFEHEHAKPHHTAKNIAVKVARANIAAGSPHVAAAVKHAQAAMHHRHHAHQHRHHGRVPNATRAALRMLNGSALPTESANASAVGLLISALFGRAEEAWFVRATLRNWLRFTLPRRRVA
jgi:hypothetical protein